MIKEDSLGDTRTLSNMMKWTVSLFRQLQNRAEDKKLLQDKE